MNKIKAIAKVKENRIIYTYKYGNQIFEIETPKTEENKMVITDEEVDILLGVAPHEPEMTEEDLVVSPDE